MLGRNVAAAIGSPLLAELESNYEPEEYATSNQYTKAKSTFSLLKDVTVGGIPFSDGGDFDSSISHVEQNP